MSDKVRLTNGDLDQILGLLRAKIRKDQRHHQKQQGAGLPLLETRLKRIKKMVHLVEKLERYRYSEALGDE